MAVVVAYGDTLERPFLFTGEAGDTLYLNGYPYAPLRRALEDQSETIPKSLPISSFEDSTRWVLSQNAAQAAASSWDSEEGRQNALNIFRASDLVESAYVQSGCCLFVKYKAFPDTIEVYLPAPGTVLKKFKYGEVPRTDWAKLHRREIFQFWALVRNGSLIEFGDTYRRSSPQRKKADISRE
ncbi:MAG TPA: hypothetical protein VFR10_03170 [bacterium]|nr:hypothetical protein [bacterium]